MAETATSEASQKTHSPLPDPPLSPESSIFKKVDISIEETTKDKTAADEAEAEAASSRTVKIEADHPLTTKGPIESVTPSARSDIGDADEVASQPKSKGKEVDTDGARDHHEALSDLDSDEDDDDDDEDDDLLDDILENFVEPTGKANALPGASSSSKAAESEEPSLGSLDDDFARQLQAGMADLLKGMEDSPELLSQFDSLVQELDKATATTGKDAQSSTTGGDNKKATSKATGSVSGIETPAESFHDTIARTMARMKESGAEIDTEMADSNTDDFLGEMLKQMQGVAGEGGSEEDFSKMLMGMMEQLTNKEILYEPMKELDDKFPGWLAENEDKQTPEEFARYREQAQLVREIVEKFDEPTYKDSNESDRTYIVDRMQKMQAVGSPPAELLGDMSQGMDGLPSDIENCPVQ